MTQIYELIDLDELEAEIREGNVRVQTHPDFPELKIANYTDNCAFSRHWTDLTRMTRGLIWNAETGEVLARPFPKFFNWDEKEAPRILDEQVLWHWDNKYDGSLGILYIDPTGHPRIATRGSFASEQALLATSILHKSGRAWVWAEYIDSGYTPLFEICGPDNRIVLRYEENFLQPLGFMHIETGMFVPPQGQYQTRTMHDLLTDLSRSNAEGWVVWLSSTKAAKIKQADYIELHRMVSNLSEKEVWRQLRAGTYDKYVAELPDELYALAEGWADGLRDQFTVIHARAVGTAAGLHMPTRKEVALWIQENVEAPHQGLIFSLLDGKDISDSIWRLLEPKGATNDLHN
jgi:RNA ligase